ncbi:MAG: histidine phosphatase family protein [Chloroflexi bacterium]|nr:histidine phosphatase family protein [Chloroflexota bacterium]
MKHGNILPPECNRVSQSWGGGAQLSQLLYVVRHCSARGQSPDAPLTPEGRAQAEALAAFLTRAATDDGALIERIVSSTFVRAQDSIAPLAVRLGVAVETDARLCERVLSAAPRRDWLDQLRASFDDLDLCLDGGESSRTAMARAAAVIEGVRRHSVRPTGLVTHGNLLALLLRHFDGRFGFDGWRMLTNPDVFRVSLGERGAHGAQVERI